MVLVGFGIGLVIGAVATLVGLALLSLPETVDEL